jgi:hypothetical protein
VIGEFWWALGRIVFSCGAAFEGLEESGTISGDLLLSGLDGAIFVVFGIRDESVSVGVGSDVRADWSVLRGIRKDRRAVAYVDDDVIPYKG